MSEQGHQPTRRSLVRGAAWSAPVILAAAAAPAYAASTQLFGVMFDGGGGANGFLQGSYLNLGAAPGTSPFVLTAPVTVTLNVVGLNPNTTRERSFSAGSSNATLVRGTYDPATRTTPFTWTIPAGTNIPVVSTSTSVPDILFSWGDGLAGFNRITNKIVVTGITGGSIVSPSAPPIDSSVVGDLKGVSPDGIY